MGSFPPSAVSAGAIPPVSAARSPAPADRLREIETPQLPAKGYGNALLIFEGQPLQVGEASPMSCELELGIPGQPEIAVGRAANNSVPLKAGPRAHSVGKATIMPMYPVSLAIRCLPASAVAGKSTIPKTKNALIGTCKVDCRIVGIRNWCRQPSDIALTPLSRRENGVLSKMHRRTERSAEGSRE